VASENQTDVQKITKIDLRKIQEDLGVGVAIDVAIHTALQEALDKDERAH